MDHHGYSNEYDDDEDVEEAASDEDMEVEAESVAEVAPDDDDGDDDDAVVVDAVVVDDDVAADEDESVVSSTISVAEQVEVVVEPPKKKRKKPGPKPKKNTEKKKGAAAAAASAPAKKKPGPKKKNAAAVAPPKIKVVSGAAPSCQEFGPLSGARLTAATNARNALSESIKTLPAKLGDATVRNMGRLQASAAPNNPFCTPSALYAVGFTCDRQDFSPAHGRMLKIRCSILDGRKILQQRKDMNIPQPPGEPILHAGPVFRLMWGRGVDEDDLDAYLYDPFLHSDYAMTNAKGSPVPNRNSSRAAPIEDMRVKTRFDDNQYFMGTIVKVNKESVGGAGGKGVKKKESISIDIRYDDGTLEHADYPDPDIQLFLPGTDPDIDPRNGRVELTKLNGKPVTSVIGLSPLEAWGRTLVKMGVIDEVMLDAGMNSLELVRSEESGKNDNGSSIKSNSVIPPLLSGTTVSASAVPGASDDDDDDDDLPRDPPSEKERFLLGEINHLSEEMKEAAEEDRQAQKSLAETRISRIGAFLGNPFSMAETTKSQQMTWLFSAIKRERARMGSNKRRVITSVEILEKSDTFYNNEINKCMEGLPGSEYCNQYVFSSQRAKRGSKAAKPEKQRSSTAASETNIQTPTEAKKNVKPNSVETAKAKEERERERKRKEREEERDQKKRQKLEEEDQRKQARINERLDRLKTQVDDRLMKEVSVQREKAVITMAGRLVKEFARRRRAAETLSAQVVLETKAKPSLCLTPQSTPVADRPLPTPPKKYSEDVVRVWDFVSTFGDFFIARKFMVDIPELDSLQNALDCIGGKSIEGLRKEDAVSEVMELAMALCKPLTTTLTRVLFASLIALNPNLQKEYGAAFFNELSSPEPPNEEDAAKSDVLLPVNHITWQEVARLAFVADALGELGLQRHEVAHILRGYRSAGHPNSKEAVRLRKIESHSIASLRQAIKEGKHLKCKPSTPKVRLDIPCLPVCDTKSHWFYIHTFISAPETEVRSMRNSLVKASEMLSGSDDNELSALREDIDAAQDLLKQAEQHPGKHDIKNVRKARRQVIASFEKHGGSKLSAKERFTTDGKWPWQLPRTNQGLARQRMGLVSALSLTREEYKLLTQKRELYMEDALKMKEDMERGKAGEDDDEDDDDDDVGSKNLETANETNQTESTPDAKALEKIGKETPYDDFAGDVPGAPELIRRCLAVLRTLAQTGAAEPFIYPVDPQTNPGYYDSLLRPMCLREAGNQLLAVPNSNPSDDAVEEAVLQFGRNIRLISANCHAYANAGAMVIAAGGEMLRIFERLFFDWVLAPRHLLPPLDQLDDDKCVEHHESDTQSTVLLCDSCEGKYNIKRLQPPLKEIPRGDWYCPRCVEGRCWRTLDPRLGKKVIRGADSTSGTITQCYFRYLENPESHPSLVYEVDFLEKDPEYWPLESVDKALASAGEEIEPIRCLEAVAESPGYGDGVDFGLRMEHLVPVPLDPFISDAAARSTLASSVFRDTVAAAASLLLVDPYEMTADEWSRLLILLIMKCSASDMLQNLATKMEAAAAEAMVPRVEALSRISDIRAIMPDVVVPDDDELSANNPAEQSNSGEVKKGDGESTSGEMPYTTTSTIGLTPTDNSDVVMDAMAVEVVEEVNAAVAPDKAPSTPSSLLEGSLLDPVSSAPVLVVSELSRDPREVVRLEKTRRHKIMEDLFIGQAIKNQLKTALATFDEDNMTPMVDSTLSGESIGLTYRSLHCRRETCSFCGLTDQALGSPLLRFPDKEEWDELITFAVGRQRTHLVADDPNGSVGTPGRLVAVRVRLDGELVSEYDPDLKKAAGDGILELLPRAEPAFQNELAFRYKHNIPFVSGSLSVHECCASAGHNARKDQMLQVFREKQAELIEQDAGLSCGRTLQIGRDEHGRAYWRLKAEPESLFVCKTEGTNIEWCRFPDEVAICGVIAALGKDPVAKELKRIYPVAWDYIKDGSWANRLLARQFPKIAGIIGSGYLDSDSDDVPVEREKEILVEGGYDPYVAGEEVLVEAKSKHFLWPASVLDLSKKGRKEPIDAYKIQYTGWSTRFVEWVHPSRVVEPSEHNEILQKELLEEQAMSRCGLPSELNFLIAKDYLNAGFRARGIAPLPDFAAIACVDKKLLNEKIFCMMKAATLAIEAALPLGSIQNTDNGVWRAPFAREWREMVRFCEGPAALMRLVIYLEDCISPEWLREDVGNLRSTLGSRWKAVGESCPAGVAVRITLLDRALKYGTYDHKRYARRKQNK